MLASPLQLRSLTSVEALNNNPTKCCARYGKVLRIITFNKNNTFQALVQLSEASASQNARAGLDGQNVYNGCCTLRIDYSKLATLNVNLVAAAAQGQLNAQAANSLSSMMPGAYTTFPMNMGSNGGGNSFYSQQALHSANDVLSAAMAAANHQNSLTPFLTGLGAGNLAAAAAAANGANAQNSALHFGQLGGLMMSSVILVSNMDENKVTRIISSLFLACMATCNGSRSSQLAIQHLDKMRWHEKVIRVTASKHTNVQMPKEGQPDAGLTRDYMNSPLHRFKKPKRPQNGASAIGGCGKQYQCFGGDAQLQTG
uniref:RRM domain-containing protein n=1 Tax=Ditylenchus dipsaci TaxID=166011 RepID=A0A915EAB4_9BILA